MQKTGRKKTKPTHTAHVKPWLRPSLLILIPIPEQVHGRANTTGTEKQIPHHGGRELNICRKQCYQAHCGSKGVYLIILYIFLLVNQPEISCISFLTAAYLFLGHHNH